MTVTYRFGTSLRRIDAEATLEVAAACLASHGVRRVVDVTPLDRVGLPVFVSIRPEGRTLAVHAGKGSTPGEARVSAVMEALEFAVAERPPSRETVSVTPREAREAHGLDFLSLCPRLGVGIPSDRPLDCLLGECLLGGGPRPLPVETVHLLEHGSGSGYFGSNTTGLASGNDVVEATLHAALEVLERDVKSFQCVRDETRLIVPESLPPPLLEVLGRIEAAGLRCALRHAPSASGVPWFQAVLWDPDALDPSLVNGGYGCHPDATTAATRAVLEAVQSRLVVIHGGRDDLIDTHRRYASMSPTERVGHLQRVLRRALDVDGQVELESVPSLDTSGPLESVLDRVLDAVGRARLGPPVRVVLESIDPRLAFVRVAIPGAENFTNAERKVGRRLVERLRAAR